MSTIRFVHCADLHLDTPFRGLAHVNSEVADTLNEATFHAWDNIVELAIRERVDFVVIAGDVYDSKDRSLRAQLRFRDGLKRLAEHCIPSFVAFGNHDPLNGWSNTLEWPQDAHRFGAGEVDSCEVLREGHSIASVHGISFARENVRENLASRFGAPADSLTSIAVLHCNVGSNTGHEPYAPATVEELSSSGFSYWALGHVHGHRVLKPDGPAIVYPGCSQSRQPNETGARGCCLVTLEDHAAPDIRFVATDTVRYYNGAVNVSGCASIDAIREDVLAACSSASAAGDGRYIVARLTLTGRSPLQQELRHGNTLSELAESIRVELFAREPWVWLERLTSDTRSTYDVEQLQQQQDFAGDIVRAYAAILESDTEALKRLKNELEKDIRSSAAGKLVETITEEEFRLLAERAMHQTLDLVLEED